jgi:hypothetical protein
MIKELKEEYNLFIEKAGKSISEYIFSMLARHPNVKSISFVHDWSQHWNDDGYSTTGVTTDCGKICYVDDMGLEENTYFDDLYDYKTKEYSHPIIEEFINFIKKVPTQFIKEYYQEGRVIFNRDGTVFNEEYDY